MTEQQTPDEIRREIERTRRELGDTVDALSQKEEVKEQARAKKDEVTQQARVKTNEAQDRVKANPAPFAAAIGGALALLLVLRFLRSR